jgi:hypothetical protein
MKEILNKLNRMAVELPSSCFFNDPAPVDLIMQFEEDQEIMLPDSYKDLLLNFNGGFISLIKVKEESDVETLAWNSNCFLSIEEIGDALYRIEQKNEWIEESFIPFLHTSGGEYLGFMNPLEGRESKVYDLWHEASATEWKQQVVYNSFRELLTDYIERNGMIVTIG